jgi:hypothetical protein
MDDAASFDGKHHTIEAITFIHYIDFEKFKPVTRLVIEKKWK